jgi:hypothetical protein
MRCGHGADRAGHVAPGAAVGRRLDSGRSPVVVEVRSVQSQPLPWRGGSGVEPRPHAGGPLRSDPIPLRIVLYLATGATIGGALVGRWEKPATGTSTSPTHAADAAGLLVRPLEQPGGNSLDNKESGIYDPDRAARLTSIGEGGENP